MLSSKSFLGKNPQPKKPKECLELLRAAENLTACIGGISKKLGIEGSSYLILLEKVQERLDLDQSVYDTAYQIFDKSDYVRETSRPKTDGMVILCRKSQKLCERLRKAYLAHVDEVEEKAIEKESRTQDLRCGEYWQELFDKMAVLGRVLNTPSMASYDPERLCRVVSGELGMTPTERDALLFVASHKDNLYPAPGIVKEVKRNFKVARKAIKNGMNAVLNKRRDSRYKPNEKERFV